MSDKLNQLCLELAIYSISYCLILQLLVGSYMKLQYRSFFVKSIELLFALNVTELVGIQSSLLVNLYNILSCQLFDLFTGEMLQEE